MNYLEKLKDITTFIFDVDGVFTNSDLLVLDSGALLRTMNVRDGYAVKRAIQQGYTVAIITGGKSEGVNKRLQGLGVQAELIYYGVLDKLAAYEDFISTTQTLPENILYMGDDLPDYPVMRLVGLGTCPHDAANEIIGIAQYVSPIKGGAGCVRDVVEKVLKVRGDWG